MPARPLHALVGPPGRAAAGVVHRRHRRRARHELLGATDESRRRGGLRARPHPAAPPGAVQRGDARLPGLDPPRPRPGRLGPYGLRLRGRRGRGGIRRRPVPRPRRQSRHSRRCPSPPRPMPTAVLRRFLPAGPRAVLPGHRHGRAAQGPAGPGARVRRRGRPASADVALVLAGPPGWGEQALDAAIDAASGPGQDRPHGLGDAARPGGAAGAGQRAGLPLPLRRVRVPAAAGHAGRCAGGGDPGRVAARGAGRRPPRWSSPAITTASPRRSRRCLGDEEERRRLIAAGTAWSARYSWERCGEGLEALYRDAAAGRG